MWITMGITEICYNEAMKMSLEEYFNLPEIKRARGGGNKFGAIKTEYDGRVFDSKAEAARAHALWLLKLSGEVVDVEYQPQFEIVVNGKKVGKYVADFRVRHKDGTVVVEDVKGLKKGSAYSIFRLKKKIVEALYGIEIVEI